MKRSIPFGKERDDFSLSINSIYDCLFHLKGEGSINKQYLMKKGKEG